MKIRVFLADDHAILRESLRNVLQREHDIEVVGEADNGIDAVRQAQERKPDVMVLDITMPGLDGIDATRRLTSAAMGTKVLALSAHAERHFIVQMLAAGARGYVLKTAGVAETVKAVRAVFHGESYFSQGAAAALFDTVGRSNGAASGDLLGRRERDVLVLLADGKTSHEIGAKLHITTGTVDAHRRNIMRKLGLHTIAQLTQYAIREHLISL